MAKITSLVPRSTHLLELILELRRHEEGSGERKGAQAEGRVNGHRRTPRWGQLWDRNDVARDDKSARRCLPAARDGRRVRRRASRQPLKQRSLTLGPVRAHCDGAGADGVHGAFFADAVTISKR